MARPKIDNNNREKMLEAGIQLLMDNGYHGMSIKQLVDQIGVPKGSFYNYFPSKEDFVDQAIKAYGERSAELILNSVNPTDSVVEQIFQVFSALEQQLCSDEQPTPCLVSALANEISQTSPQCRTQLKAVQDLARESLSELVLSGQESGEIVAHLPNTQIADLLYNGWHGQLLEFQISGDRTKLQQQTQTLLSLIQTKPDPQRP